MQKPAPHIKRGAGKAWGQRPPVRPGKRGGLPPFPPGLGCMFRQPPALGRTGPRGGLGMGREPLSAGRFGDLGICGPFDERSSLRHAECRRACTPVGGSGERDHRQDTPQKADRWLRSGRANGQVFWSIDRVLLGIVGRYQSEAGAVNSPGGPAPGDNRGRAAITPPNSGIHTDPIP